MKRKVVKNMCGGEGEVTTSYILDETQLTGNCSLFAVVRIESGSSLGYHEHHGECETYYILSGEGEYDDNGIKRRVKEGDVTVTPDGFGHAIKPVTQEPLIFIALILKD